MKISPQNKEIQTLIQLQNTCEQRIKYDPNHAYKVGNWFIELSYSGKYYLCNSRYKSKNNKILADEAPQYTVEELKNLNVLETIERFGLN
jgi:hypothetical protein